MPEPLTNETKNEFIDRCIPIVIKDGTAEDSDQAFAICSSMWDNKEAKMTEEVETIVEEEVKEKPNSAKAVVASIVPYDAMSFEEVDEFMKAETVRERMGEVTRQFESLTHNIMYADDGVDKVKAMKSLVSELDTRLKEAIDLGSTTIWDAVKSLFKKKEAVLEPGTRNGFFVWKEGDRFRWFAVYSNKYRDQDAVPEIISEKAHLRFVEMIDSGKVPYPELWHWHIPGSRWGEADWIAYDQENGFSLASGFVDIGHENEAKAIAELDKPLAVSHGLFVLERNKDDETIIDAYISQEISDLPVDAAANKLTGFSLIEAKEALPMIPDEKKKHLLSVGLTERQIDEIEQDLDAKASKADEAGLEFKEAEEPKPEAETPEVEVVEEPETETSEDEKEIDVDTPVEDLTLPASRQEVAEAITEVVKPITDQLSEITETITGLKKSDVEKIKEVAEDTPAFSIAAMVQQDLSVIGKKETETDEAEGPLENKDGEKSITGLPWVDSMLAEEK